MVAKSVMRLNKAFSLSTAREQSIQRGNDNFDDIFDDIDDKGNRPGKRMGFEHGILIFCVWGYHNIDAVAELNNDQYVLPTIHSSWSLLLHSVSRQLLIPSRLICVASSTLPSG